ncbi:MAG: hypothetical protein WC047_02390 [Kiritimatiellales bacterium]
MRKNALRFRIVLIAVAGLLSVPVFADLGLSQLAATQGASAVGQAVLTAAKAVYADNADPVVIQQQLIAILNEAAATGNEQAIRYAIVAVMLAGGADNLAQSMTAINNSNVFSQYPELTAVTVAAAQALISGGAGGTTGGGELGGGGQQLGGGDPNSLGGGSDFLSLMGIDPDNPFAPENQDTVPTPI